VRQLARLGFTVLLASRDEKRGRQAAERLRAEGLGVEPVRLDVTSDADRKDVARRIEERFGRLDVLVNNAGVGNADSRAATLADDELRTTFETNFFAAVALTRELLPLIRKSDGGRIVNVSSQLGSLTLNDGGGFDALAMAAYKTSKAALNMYTLLLAHELRDTPIKVNAADPGYVATDMNRHQGVRSVAQGAATPVRLATLPSDGPTGGYFNDAGSVPW
jgi:NAD(P)-dependent dehydrogenase (short-subunit alcohol dehydrogenase family)